MIALAGSTIVAIIAFVIAGLCGIGAFIGACINIRDGRPWDCGPSSFGRRS